jgi:hypothetical protein
VAHGQELDVAVCDVGLGTVHASTGRYAEAIDAFLRARATYAAEDQQLDVAACDCSLGAAYGSAARYGDAQQALEDARAIYVALGDSLGTAHCDSFLGSVFLLTDRFMEAIDAIRAAGAAYEALQNPLAVASCDSSLARAHWVAGRYPQALGALASARATYAAYRRPLDVATCDLQLGEVAHEQGSLAEALAALVPAVLFLDAQRIQFPTGAQRRVWAEENVASGFREALEIAAELGDPKLVAELVEASKSVGALAGRTQHTGSTEVAAGVFLNEAATSGWVPPPVNQKPPNAPLPPSGALLAFTASGRDEAPIAVAVRLARGVRMPWHSENDYALAEFHHEAVRRYDNPTTGDGPPVALTGAP